MVGAGWRLSATAGAASGDGIGVSLLGVPVGEAPGAAMEVEAGRTVGSTINGGWVPQAASVKPKVRATTTDHITTNVRLPPPSQGVIISLVKALRRRQGV